MTPLHFSYFLQGFAELTSKPPTPAQWAMIRTKLNSVFEKVTPDRSATSNEILTASHQWVLDLIGREGISISEGPICGVNLAGESPLVKPTYCQSMPGSELTHIIGPSSCHPILPFKIETNPSVSQTIHRTC